MSTSREPRCRFVPPWLLARVAAADVDPALVDCCRDTLALDTVIRERRSALAGGEAVPVGEDAWTVHTADGTTRLPGRPVRTPGSEPSGDLAADEAAAGIEATLRMFAEALGRDSSDGRGVPVSLTVHYGRDYDNAFWDGTQLVFGDGDGRLFERFTKPVDVLAHEFAHALTEHTAGLVYLDQPGALNESVSDVFAACLKQWLLGQDAEEADWLVGEGLFKPGVQARALRDMAAPGTAFDDPLLGRDPQVGHMDDFVDTTDDNGGVHLNSGIPNRAFHLAALAVGGSTVEGAGRIWYAALTGGDVGPATDFAGFATATVAAAGPHAEAVRRAWEQVGVSPAASTGSGPAPGGPAGLVRVTRSGGFAGLTTTAEVDLSGDDAHLDDVRAVLARVDLAHAKGHSAPMPDAFVYTFEVDDLGPVRLPEQDLTDDLRTLAGLVLERGRGDLA